MLQKHMFTKFLEWSLQFTIKFKATDWCFSGSNWCLL